MKNEELTSLVFKLGSDLYIKNEKLSNDLAELFRLKLGALIKEIEILSKRD